MAGQSDFTDTQKAGYVTTALKDGRAAAAKAAGVSMTTISHWAKQRGVDLRAGADSPTAVKKKTAKKKTRAKRAANGATNGHAAAPPAGAGIDSVHEQLTAALKTLDTVRAAFRQVFG